MDLDDVLLECANCPYVQYCPHAGSSPTEGENKSTVRCRLVFMGTKGPIVAIPVGCEINARGFIDRINIRNVLIKMPWIKRITKNGHKK